MIKRFIAILLVFTMPLLIALPTYADCGDTKTHLISCDGSTGTGSLSALISITLTVMSILVGIVAVGGIAYAGAIYASARDDQTKVDEAKRIIRNIIVGIVLYASTIAIIGWLIPSNVINSPSPSPSSSTSPSPSSTASPSPSGQSSSH
jgi:Na+-driven multidrug efflux pump